MLKSELMAASGPSPSQTPTYHPGNHSAAAVIVALGNALNFPLTRDGYFYEKSSYAGGSNMKQWLGSAEGTAA
jgi:hypothetical protein